MNVMKILNWLDKNFELVLLGFLLAILTSFSFVNVVLRYVIKQGIPWSDEVCKYSFVLSGFFSIPIWIRYSTGLRVEAFVEMIPKIIRKILSYLIYAAMLVFFCIMMHGIMTVIEGAKRINQLSPALRLPMVYLYFLIAIAFTLSIVRLIQVIFIQLKSDISRKRG